MQSLTDVELHDIIEEQIINPSINEEIQTLVKSRKKWRTVTNISETLGQISIVASTILAFASGFYRCEMTLAFVAGSINVASLAFLKFGSYAANESIERNKLLNELLIRCDVKPMGQPTYSNETNGLNPVPRNVAQANVTQANVTQANVTPISSNDRVDIQIY